MADTQSARALAASSDGGRGRRRWRNFFFKPGFQFKYTWYFVGAGLAMFGITAAMIERRLVEVVALTNRQPIQSMAEQGHMQDLFVEITKISLVGFSAYVIFSFLLAFLLSHRVSGPMVALVDIIGQFKRGNYGYRRSLRRRDELRQIHRELVELGEALEGRVSQQGSAGKMSVVDPRARADS